METSIVQSGHGVAIDDRRHLVLFFPPRWFSSHNSSPGTNGPAICPDCRELAIVFNGVSWRTLEVIHPMIVTFVLKALRHSFKASLSIPPLNWKL